MRAGGYFPLEEKKTRGFRDTFRWTPPRDPTQRPHPETPSGGLRPRDPTQRHLQVDSAPETPPRDTFRWDPTLTPPSSSSPPK
ncbi:unnamed protein product [Gadus morhua 'NCC']